MTWVQAILRVAGILFGGVMLAGYVMLAITFLDETRRGWIGIGMLSLLVTGVFVLAVCGLRYGW